MTLSALANNSLCWPILCKLVGVSKWSSLSQQTPSANNFSSLSRWVSYVPIPGKAPLNQSIHSIQRHRQQHHIFLPLCGNMYLGSYGIGSGMGQYLVFKDIVQVFPMLSINLFLQLISMQYYKIIWYIYIYISTYCMIEKQLQLCI
jgi:hypothetical protein